MYEVDASNAQEILCYHDLFSDNAPNIKDEIEKINMHMAISIISELINARTYKIEVKACGLELTIPFDAALKKLILGTTADNVKEFFSNPILHKGKRIISLQMLLILLKYVFAYGNYSTLNKTEYTITDKDYVKIIKLQLTVAEQYNNEFDENKVDLNHFIYANYHLNYDKNAANGFMRSYYMLERLAQDKNCFESDVQKEYRNYFDAFIEKYHYTTTQYLSLLFWELSAYYPPVNRLTHSSIWRNIDTVYGKTAMHKAGIDIINDLSRSPHFYKDWASQTINEMWNFSCFSSFPFIKLAETEYISISEWTLKNAFFEKLFWQIRECYTQDDSRAMAFYGRLFEKYIQDLTLNASCNNDFWKYIPEFRYGKQDKKSSDAYIRQGPNLLVIEAKGYSILQNSFVKNKDIEKNNRKLFIHPIIQADERFYEIEENCDCFNEITDVYIISVTMDSINAVPSYLDSIYAEIADLKKSDKTKYVFNFNIEEYEMLMYLTQENFNIFDLLSDYYHSNRIMPFSTYLHVHVRGKIEMTNFMSAVYKEACEKMKSMYELQD